MTNYYEKLFTKAGLLLTLESIPQSYWPPRPTRQDKATLFDAVSRAYRDGYFGDKNWYRIASEVQPAAKPRQRLSMRPKGFFINACGR